MGKLKLKLITIDCWNTILINNPVWDRKIEDLLFSYCQTLNDKCAGKDIPAAFREEESNFSESLKDSAITISSHDRLQYFFDKLIITVSINDKQRLVSSIDSLIHQPPPSLVKYAKNFLIKLRATQTKVCLISNTGWFSSKAITAALKYHNIAHYFHDMIFSDVLGHAKPSKEIFKHALEVFDCQPSQALHIGDTVNTDVLGAHAVGYNVILFTGISHSETNMCSTFNDLESVMEYIIERYGEL